MYEYKEFIFMINDRIVSSFVFLILVVSFIGCGSKPSKDIVENAVFTKYCNPDSMFSDIFINSIDKKALEVRILHRLP